MLKKTCQKVLRSQKSKLLELVSQTVGTRYNQATHNIYVVIQCLVECGVSAGDACDPSLLCGRSWSMLQCVPKKIGQ